MTQYLLAVHGSEEEYAAMARGGDAEDRSPRPARFNEKVQAGIWVFAGGLKPSSRHHRRRRR